VHVQKVVQDMMIPCILSTHIHKEREYSKCLKEKKTDYEVAWDEHCWIFWRQLNFFYTSCHHRQHLAIRTSLTLLEQSYNQIYIYIYIYTLN